MTKPLSTAGDSGAMVESKLQTQAFPSNIPDTETEPRGPEVGKIYKPVNSPHISPK